MTTNNYQSLRLLNDRQLIAISALIGGATHAEAAAQAGVHRVTVTDWVGHHPAVRAELNRRRNEIAEQRQHQLRELDAAALDAAAAYLANSDGEFALKWLKLRGLNATVFPDTGPTDPEEIINELVTARVAATTAEAASLKDPGELFHRPDAMKIKTEVEAELAATLGENDIT
jgi:hypothetical protein